MSKKRQTPKHQKCTVCDYNRVFLHMQEKIGKDNRMARWPVYEICPNKNDPEFHPAANNADLLAQELSNPAPAAPTKHIPRPVGLLYQVADERQPLNEIADALLRYEEVYPGKTPVEIGVQADEMDGWETIEWETAKGEPVEIPVRPAQITGRYGYLFLISAYE